MYYHAVPLSSSRWHCMYGKCNVALWMMLLQPVLALLDQVKGIYYISEQGWSWTWSCMGHINTGDVIHDPFGRLLLWGAWWIPSPWCIDCIIIGVKKKEDRHICIRKINIWKGFTILYPQIIMSVFISCAPSWLSKKKNCKKPSFAFASSLLPASSNHL